MVDQSSTDQLEGGSVVALNITDTDPLAGGNDTVPYSETLTGEGGNGSYTWAVTVGALPSGLSLDASTGEISGTPDTVENPTFTVTLTDAFGVEATEVLSIDIAA